MYLGTKRISLLHIKTNYNNLNHNAGWSTNSTIVIIIIIIIICSYVCTILKQIYRLFRLRPCTCLNANAVHNCTWEQVLVGDLQVFIPLRNDAFNSFQITSELLQNIQSLLLNKQDFLVVSENTLCMIKNRTSQYIRYAL